MRVVIYLRVSTEEQASEGVSLSTQEARCRAYATLYGHDVVSVESDAGASGKSLARPGLAAARASLASGDADGILVAKLDRLTRSVSDLGELLETTFKTGSLLSVGEQIDASTAAGRMVLHILASVAQWERETIVERTTSALAHKRAAGEVTGAIPYGYRREGDSLVLEPSEQAVIAMAKELSASGASLRSISARLAETGHLSRTGRPFTAQAIKNMVG